MKKPKCENCKYFSENCTHKSNIGLSVKYRHETEFFIKTPQELNKNGKCKNYEIA